MRDREHNVERSIDKRDKENYVKIIESMYLLLLKIIIMCR